VFARVVISFITPCWKIVRILELFMINDSSEKYMKEN